MLAGKQQYIVIKTHTAPVNSKVQTILKKISARFKAGKKDCINRKDHQDSQDREEDDHQYCTKPVFIFSLFAHTIFPPS